MKTCSECGIVKPFSDFGKKSSSKDGFAYKCKECMKIQRTRYREKNKEYYEKNKEVIMEQKKEWKSKNETKVKHYKKKYYENNKEKIKKRKKKYYENNKEQISEKIKQYAKENKEALNEKSNERRKQRRETDENYRMKCSLRTRIHNALKQGTGFKTGSSQELLGCDWETVRKHLEEQFTEGMTWENHGKWQYHIIPCASFDLTDPEEQQKCFHYTNLQPLWAEDNLRKSDTISEEWDNELMN